MCTVKTTKKLNSNFIVTNVVLSIEGKFTIEEAYDRVKEQESCISMNMLINTIKRLRENDYLEEMGHTYSVIPKEKSVRWGGYHF